MLICKTCNATVDLGELLAHPDLIDTDALDDWRPALHAVAEFVRTHTTHAGQPHELVISPARPVGGRPALADLWSVPNAQP